MVVRCGVPKRGWTAPIHAGSSPSLDIAMKIRGCAIICTTIVEVSPARMAILTSSGITLEQPLERGAGAASRA